MKKFIIICLLCLWATTNTNAQMRDTTLNMNTHKVDANSLFQKSKNQKITGFILLAGGAALEVAAIAITSADLPGSIINEKKSKRRTPDCHWRCSNAKQHPFFYSIRA